MIQDLSSFRMPPGFRGRSVVVVQLWWWVQSFLFHPSPRFANGWRRWLLRCFGARVGRDVLIRPSVKVTYPWKVTIGDYAWIGEDVELYSLAEIEIGNNAVVSQHSYLCAGDHDYRYSDFPIRGKAIRIADEAWVASHSFIAPGVTIGQGAVVAACSAVFRDMPAGMICMGSPCRPVRPRADDSPMPQAMAQRARAPATQACEDVHVN
ncbi:WcaF family extracellular polysaccharide biosynthesis acetyltransferase [Cupriavidus pampae]|uniref:2,3,4,5-tetrahydropyridine-2,6-dicarboxylate N-acetyltransferase n=1 Tax=Cupriavidus pampae TaxID=659251 RepID=A0ABN7ZCG9_9BURK|nr:WcaF family extracellular polysaccharide biosynthesis acetyltransferase [Cupriavidus pampae]CAG9181990.1 2,3,4,5-tetrahydropyridine-2,6-dicarboxylate N-acetyltransferase [Cupriavidus pampae]